MWKSNYGRTLSDVNPEMAGEMRLALAGDCRVEDGIVFLESTSGPTHTLVLPKEAMTAGSTPSQVVSNILDRVVEQTMTGVIDGVGEGQEGSNRLFPLRTRGDGHNCLLNAASLGLWGVQDRDLLLRCAVCDTMNHPESGARIRRRWEADLVYSNMVELGMELSQEQLDAEWKEELDHIRAPDVSLGTVHVFALAQVLRRPVVVYAAAFVKGSAGDDLEPDRFAGIFLPLLWEPSQCTKVPLAMTFTFSPGNECGHFSALVAVAADEESGEPAPKLSLMRNKALLPVRYLKVGPEGDSWDETDRLSLLDIYMEIVDASGRPRRASRGRSTAISGSVYASVQTGAVGSTVGARLFEAYERDIRLHNTMAFLSKAGAMFLVFIVLLLAVSVGSWAGGAGKLTMPRSSAARQRPLERRGEM